MSLDPGTRLGPYEILGPVGSGGMGEVYRARDTRLGRVVAVKVLRHDVAADADRIERFEREARSASSLNHPNIVTIHDVGVSGATSFIAMELVDGTSLRNMLVERKPLPVASVLGIGAQIAEGLAKAHAAGIVHRDLKPENVMVTPDGLVKILDFGLAKLVARDEHLGAQLATQAGTSVGLLLGTVGYMSPEQATGAAIDYRSDQFALGVILYELATGSRAFRRDSAPQTLAAIIEDDPAPVDSLNPRLPPQFARIVVRCLAKKPDDRYESTRDLAHDLRDLVHDSSASSGVSVRSKQAGVPRLAWLGLLAASIAIAGVSAWLIVRSPADDKSPAHDIQKIVAVLPFKDLTGDPSQAYFAAGVTEEIRGQLSKLVALRLLSRSAVQRYGEGDIRRLRTELGAGSAVEGSVRLERDRVRVAVQLIDTASEQTLWSEQYDRTLAGVLSVQSDVALRIAEALKATLSPDERRRVEKAPTENAEAYRTYLRSLELSSLERQQNLRGIELLRKALDLDPNFALAQARLAYRTFFLAYYDDPKYLDQAIEQARRAIEMDPTLSTGFVALASAYAVKGWAAKARSAFLKAQELNPGDGSPVANLAVTESEVLGRHDAGLSQARRLLDFGPVAANGLYHIAWPMLFLRDDATTDRWLKEAEQRFPNFPRLQYLRAGFDYLRGNEADALSRMRKLGELHPANEEILTVLAELTYLTGASDAEERTERFFRRAPGLATTQFLKPESHQTTYAHLLMKRGEHARGLELLKSAMRVAQAALADGNESVRVPMEIAAIHAARDEREQALEWLDRGLTAGYKDYSTLARNPIFENVRRDARFAAVLKKMEQAVAAMRDGSTVLAEMRTMPFPAVAAR
jgi:eukaryotic-like serine/threonine-protein kinase